MTTATPAARWERHLRAHGPTDAEELETLLVLAQFADEDGRTGYVDDETGDLITVRMAPCRECGLGLDA